MTGDYSVFQVVQPWVELEATWANASKDIKWVNAGGDYVSKSIAKVTWPRSNGNTWMKFNVLSTVQNFVKIPDMNYGFLIRNVSGSQEIDLAASEHESAEFRPKLTIGYDEGTAAMTTAKAKAVDGISVEARRRGLHFTSGSRASAVFATIARPDGRSVFSDRIPPGSSRLVTGLGAGIYFISIRQAGHTERMTVSIVP